MATTGVELATAYVTLAISTRGMESDIRKQFGRVEGSAKSAGKTIGKNYAKAIGASVSSNLVGLKGQLDKATADVEKYGTSLTRARRAEADAAGAVRVAEARLADVRASGRAKASQIAAAEENLAKVQRALDAAQDNTKRSTAALAEAQDRAKRSASALAAEQSKANVPLKDSPGLAARASSGMGNLASKVASAAKVYGALAAAGVAFAGVSFLKGAVTEASNFQQALGGADAVFKKEAAGIKRSAEAAAEALGLSKNQYLELATVLGAGLKNKGVKDFAKQSKSLIKIGSDLAAQFGGSTEEAVNALASALRGESDPIERYGVSLNETAINAKLAADGAKKVNGAYTEQQKTAARLALITQQTADAQGAFARESDTYAGKQQRLAATWENIKTQVGGALLPALTDLSDWFLKTGLPAVKEFGGWVKDELWPALKDGFERVRPGLEKAQKIITEAFGGESKATLKDFASFVTDKLIPGIAEFANVWLPIAATQISGTIEAVKGLYNAFVTLRDFQVRVASAIIGGFIKVMNVGADMLEALSQVPGFGWAKDAADKMRELSGTAAGVKAALDRIPDKKNIKITAQVSMPGRITLPGGERVNIGLREAGGPVRKGQPYIVGEKRPELFVPDQNGKILPRVPDGGGTPLGGVGIDYGRLSDVMTDSMRRVSLAVDTRDNARAVARERNARAML